MSAFVKLMIVALALSLGGCAVYPVDRDRADTVVSAETRRPILPVEAVVVDASPARIVRDADRQTRMGAVGVGAAGGALLAQTGKRNMTKTTLFAALGGLLGDTAARHANEPVEGEQVVVELVTEGKGPKRKLAVVQQVAGAPLSIGEKVWVIHGPQATRIVRKGSGALNPAPAVSVQTGW